jgi:hypothetical protein
VNAPALEARSHLRAHQYDELRIYVKHALGFAAKSLGSTEHNDCFRKFIDNFCESAAPPVDTTLHVKVASEHSSSHRSKWLKVVNWLSHVSEVDSHIF